MGVRTSARRLSGPKGNARGARLVRARIGLMVGTLLLSAWLPSIAGAAEIGTVAGATATPLTRITMPRVPILHQVRGRPKMTCAKGEELVRVDMRNCPAPLEPVRRPCCESHAGRLTCRPFPKCPPHSPS